jgi:hypothetical protein
LQLSSDDVEIKLHAVTSVETPQSYNFYLGLHWTIIAADPGMDRTSIISKKPHSLWHGFNRPKQWIR